MSHRAKGHNKIVTPNELSMKPLRSQSRRLASFRAGFLLSRGGRFSATLQCSRLIQNAEALGLSMDFARLRILA